MVGKHTFIVYLLGAIFRTDAKFHTPSGRISTPCLLSAVAVLECVGFAWRTLSLVLPEMFVAVPGTALGALFDIIVVGIGRIATYCTRYLSHRFPF